MPGWSYFASLHSVLDPCSDTPVLNGSTLSIDERGVLCVRGTRAKWDTHKSIRRLLTRTSLVRLRLVHGENLCGVHVDVKRSTFTNTSTEILLQTALEMWSPCMYVHRPPLVYSQPVAFSGKERRCTRKPTVYQANAVNWMAAHEGIAGTQMRINAATPVPGTDLCFSHSTSSFVPMQVGDSRSIVVRAGALTGLRGTGKTQIIRTLLSMPANSDDSFVSQFPLYVTSSTLVVVPSGILDQWEEALMGLSPCVLRTADEAIAWVHSTPGVVLVTYAALCRAITHHSTVYTSHAMDHILRRRGARVRSLDAMTWHRIVYDEYYLSGTGDVNMSESMDARMTWAVQGGASSQVEHEIVQCLYPDELVTSRVSDAMVFNQLPVVVAVQPVERMRRTLYASSTETQLAKSMHILAPDMVYAQYDHDWVTHVDGYDEIVGAASEVVRRMADAPPVDAPETNIIASVVVNGTEIFIEGISSDDSEYGGGDPGDAASDETSDDPDYDQVDGFFAESSDDASDDVPPPPVSLDFLNTRVADLHAGTTEPLCNVCLESRCDTVLLCGHTMCYVCCVTLVCRESARCPECRHTIVPGGVFTVSKPYAPIIVTWLLGLMDAHRDGDLFIIGSDPAGVARLAGQLPPGAPLHVFSDIAGRTESQTGHIVLLDDRCKPPAKFTSESGEVPVTRVVVRPSDA